MTKTECKPTASERLEAEIRKVFDKRFEKFKITERMRFGVYRSWYCAEPGCWDCSFTITTIPGQLIVTGDLGSLIVERTFDMLPWCRCSCESTGYFAEKVPHEIPTKEFSHEVLREWIEEKLSEIRDEFDKAHGEEIDDVEELAEKRELLENALDRGLEDDGDSYWRREFDSISVGCDPPNWDIWKRRFLILREAVRWFVMNHNELPIE